MVGIGWLLFAISILVVQLSQPLTITIHWQTATEQATAGFFVTRSLSADGPFQRQHDQLIPTAGSATSGATYQFVDSDVMAGQTYFYLLEEVEFDTTVNRYATFMQEHKAVRLSGWWRGITAVFTLTGIYLIITNLQKRRENEPQSISSQSRKFNH